MPPQIQGLVDFTEVGRGGFGVVYKATEARFGRAVAVKVIRGDVGIERNVIARFERECLALGSLSGHPNIVAVHDSGTAESGEHYLVMEFLGGGSMGQLLAASGPANPTDAATWGMALAGALETAHRSGIIHRDVKPDNILFSQYGAPKLVDFGIARMRSAYETRSGVVSATLSHAAPEIVAGAPVTASADVYSLSSVLFTILHGRSPFDRGPEDSLAPLIARIASATPPDLRADGVPDELAAVIERGLAKTPEERYPSAQALGEALREALRAISGRSVAVPLGEEAMVAEAAAVISEGPTTTEEEVEADLTTKQTPAPVVAKVAPAVKAPKAPKAPQAAPAPAPRRTRGRVGALLLVMALLVTVGFCSDDRDRKPAADATPDANGPVTMTYRLVKIDSTISAQRTDSAADGRVTSSVRLTNTSGKKRTFFWAETIPKELARDVSEVTFSPSNEVVLEADPIVYWRIPLGAGKSTTVEWSTAVPAGYTVDQPFIILVGLWHATAMQEKSDFVAAQLKRVAAAEGGKVVDPKDAAPDVPDPTSTPSASSEPTRSPTAEIRINGASNRTSNERSSGSMTISATPSNAKITVTGLPLGLTSSGGRISGTISANAAKSRTHYTQSASSKAKVYTVRVVARVGGKSKSTTFSWRVNDTHLVLPSYTGKYGGEGPYPVRSLGPYHSTGCYDPEISANDDSQIVKQSVAKNSNFQWGGYILFTYGHRDKPEQPRC